MALFKSSIENKIMKIILYIVIHFILGTKGCERTIFGNYNFEQPPYNILRRLADRLGLSF